VPAVPGIVPIAAPSVSATLGHPNTERLIFPSAAHPGALRSRCILTEAVSPRFTRRGSPVDTDRNLLFGVLALQADLLDRDRFIQACALWAARKDIPLADLLVEQGWLTAQDRSDVERLLDRKLQKHGGDARASLAEAAGPTVRGALASVADRDVEQSLVSLGDTPSALPLEGEVATTPRTEGAGRNLLYEEIGRGGMGCVLRGRDPDLRRDLAVKILREEHRSDPCLVRRFVEEAQIGGQLQHPGVVPVYELGRFADRRPYFTMKLVKGRTLAELLKERIVGPASSRPADMAGWKPAPQDLPRFLTIFEQVCQTVAYAHSKRVIHRDLKPSNVMVGAFGEVQVMDWGLAKVLGTSDGDPEATTARTLIHTVRSGSTAEEDGRTGVVGTPAYMAPEQARGEVEAVDERADVFGLGSILCVILTGQPPYASAARAEVLRQAAAGDVAPAFVRLESCGADAELVVLARTCLSPERARRPRDAGEVAVRVAAYQAAVQERLRAAELERAAAEARAEEAKATTAAERKARRRTAGMAVALLLLAVGGGSGAWLWQQEQQARQAQVVQRRQEADAAAQKAMAEARLLLEQAQTAAPADEARFREANAAAEKAAALARPGEASEEVQGQATDLVALVKSEAEAAGRDRRLLAALLEVRRPREGPKFQRDDQGLIVVLVEPSADEQFRAAFRDWGLNLDAGPASAAARLKGRPPGVVAEIIASLDEWAAEQRQRGRPRGEWQRLVDLAAALDAPATKHAALRALLARDDLGWERVLGALSMALRPVPVPFDAGLGKDRSRLRQLAEQANPAREPTLGLLTLARGLLAAGDDARAEHLLRAATRARPQEVVLYYSLGQFLERQRPPRWAEAVECYAAARALRPELGDALAYALVSSNRTEEGLALYERLVAERPDNPWLHMRRGNALDNAGRFKEAEAAHREAIRLQPGSAPAHTTLGIALYKQGRYQEAEAACRQATRLQPGFPVAYDILGFALLGQHRDREAEAACRQAIRIGPGDASAYRTLGISLTRQDRHKEAEAAFRGALRIQPDFPEALSDLGKDLTAQDRHREAEAAYREVVRFRPDSAQAHADLGYSLGRQGRYKEAEAACRVAIRLKPDFAEALNGLGAAVCSQGRHQEAEAICREVLRLQPDYAEGSVNLGNALTGQRRYAEAEAAIRKAIRVKPDLFEAYLSLDTILYDQGRYGEAATAARELVRLKHGSADAHNRLGNALYKRGQQPGAEAAYREALRLRPSFPEAHVNLSNTLVGQGRPREAETACREAIRLKPDYLAAHVNLGATLLEQHRFADAETAFRAALRLQPNLPEARCNLGIALRDQGHFAEALKELRQGHAEGSKRPGWRYRSADWIRQCEHFVTLDRKLSAVLNGEAEPADGAERLALGRLCQHYKQRHAAAARFYADAFAADPRVAADVGQGHRYDAACSAALAAAGQGEDAKNLPDKVQRMLRRQALGWLRSDLALYAKLAEREEPAAKQFTRQRLAHWQEDADLAGVHDREALDRLPDDERKEWRQLWDDVAALLKKVKGKK
jgi:tetratricopeptide (TPR) repeat protein/tRNA A-37 threonylcarbamoyl transferase component Bud32